MNLTFLSPEELEIRSAAENFNKNGKNDFLNFINKSKTNAKEVREILNLVANHQENYEIRLHKMALKLSQIGFVFNGENFCEKLGFFPEGNEYYFHVQSVKGEMIAELIVDFANNPNSAINGSFSLNSFNFKTSFSRAKIDLPFKKNTYSTSWFNVYVEKYMTVENQKQTP